MHNPEAVISKSFNAYRAINYFYVFIPLTYFAFEPSSLYLYYRHQSLYITYREKRKVSEMIYRRGGKLDRKSVLPFDVIFINIRRYIISMEISRSDVSRYFFLSLYLP